MISETLATVLRSGRADFNARYEVARQRYPVLEGTAFGRFLEESVDPLARATDRFARDRIPAVVSAAYDVGLDLVGQRLLGHEERERRIEATWRELTLPLLPVVALEPARVLPAFANALFNLTITPGARPEQWAGDMRRLGVQCSDSGQLLLLGQVLAWRAGLAHFRQGALTSLPALPKPLLLAAMGAAAESDCPTLLRCLETDPWFNPAGPPPLKGARRSLANVGRLGAFRGYGGLFVEPPVVASTSEHLYVRSGDDCWLLFADAFGSTLHRATTEEFTTAQKTPFTADHLRLTGSRLVWDGRSFDLPAKAEVASFAATTTTAALTCPVSFAITLIAAT